jgi:hypothetical protein
VNDNAGAATLKPRNGLGVASTNAPALTHREPLLPILNVPSACPTDEVRMGNRIDPYWADIWPVGSKASWVDVRNARAQEAAGVGRLPAYLTADEATTDNKLVDPNRLPHHLNILSVLDSWRTATGEQLAAFTGQTALATGRSQTMTDLFTSELVDVGIFSNVLFNTRNTARGALYRPATGNAFEKKVAPNLTYTEWVATTGGISARVGGGQHDRHNIIATELALRVAEVCDIGNVVGEKLSLADLLGYTGLGLPSKGKGYTRAADFTIIRQDGLRIAVEVTATLGRALDLKMQHWAELLEDRRMDDSGLAVLFILVDKPGGSTRGANAVRNSVFKQIRETVRNTPGPNFDRVANRIGVADWREWFPQPGVVSPSFFELDCWRPTGDPAGGTETLWEPASFLNQESLPFNPVGDWAETALDNMALLRSTPAWLKEGRTPPELWPTLLRQAGLEGIPIPLMARPELTSGTREFGKAHGFVGETKPPTRLRSER